MIILNKYPPELYGNLKILCDDLEVSYSTYSKKKFPMVIDGIEVFKSQVKRGKKKTKIDKT